MEHFSFYFNLYVATPSLRSLSTSFLSQVPDKFLEVAEITLHEFYKAISVAKDSDPSWKKAIYKVICKLDSDVPDEFKTSSYL